MYFNDANCMYNDNVNCMYILNVPIACDLFTRERTLAEFTILDILILFTFLVCQFL